MRRSTLLLALATVAPLLEAQSRVPGEDYWIDPVTGWADAVPMRTDADVVNVPGRLDRIEASGWTRMQPTRVVPQTLRPAPPVEGGACLLATSRSVRALALPSVDAAQTVVVLETSGDRLLTSREYRFAAPAALRTASTDGATTLTGLPGGVPFDVVGVDHRTERFMSVRVEGDRAIPLRSGDVRDLKDDDPHRELVARALDARRRCATSGG